jgi:RNA polymerase sigma-70 factor (ECF subfamily)
MKEQERTLNKTGKSVEKQRVKTQFEKETHALQQESDSILINRAFRGDQAAFESLVSRYHSSIFLFVRRHCTDDELVEDIVQFVFFQLYLALPRLSQNLSSPRTTRPLRAWLLRVAANRCIDEGRYKHPLRFSEIGVISSGMGEAEEEISLEECLIDRSPLPEEVAEQHDQQKVVDAAIDALPGTFRCIVRLRYTEELTFKEIGHRLQMREGTVRTYFRRARPLLRTFLLAQKSWSR